MRATPSMIAGEIKNIVQDLNTTAQRIKENVEYSFIQVSSTKDELAKMRKILNELNRYIKAYEKEISSKQSFCGLVLERWQSGLMWQS